MKLRHTLLCLVVLTSALTTALKASAAEIARTQEEFGFSVALPKGPICDSASGGHHHGWGAPLDGDCTRANRSIVVLADYNAGFLTSPEEAAYCNPANGGSFKEGAKLGLKFAGRRSATCLTRKPDRSVLVTVVTQAGQWPDRRSDDPPEFRTAWINYYAYLQTTPDRLDADLPTFRRVLLGIRIVPRRQTAEHR